jgi:hypothetical protein
LDALPRLVRSLGEACGLELMLVEESVIVEGAYVAATARSMRVGPGHEVEVEALAKVLISPGEEGGDETWALLFVFVHGERVAPPGKSHLALKLEGERWRAVGWEVDDYGEWAELERLDE